MTEPTAPQPIDDELEMALRGIDDALAQFERMAGIAQHLRTVIAHVSGEAGRVIRQPHVAGLRAIPSQPVRDHDDRDRLTRRQQEVLDLLVQGASNRQIGRALHITEQTVKAHLHVIYRKLGAGDRTEAAVLALRWGLATDVPPGA